MVEESQLQRAIREKREREAAATPAPPALPAVPVADEYSDLGLEDVHEAGTYVRSTEDLQIDSIIDSLSVMEAYSKFVPKDPRTRRAGTNEFLVSCPNPAHPDKTPSCSVNTEKQLWTCYSCGKSGDAIDLAALNLGYTDDSYKQGKNFVELRKSIAGKLGWVPSHKNLAGQQVYTQQVEQQITEAAHVAANLYSAPPPPPSISTLTLDPAAMVKKMATQGQVVTGSAVPVTSITAAPSYVEPEHLDEDTDLDEDKDFNYPSIDWRAIVPEDTFLYEYISATSQMEVPEEYHFWNGMVAIGAALGHKVSLFGEPVRVYGNLYVCTVGPSGGGKTQATFPLMKMLHQVMKYEPDDEFNLGIKHLGSPASGESLIDQFQREIYDINNPKAPPVVTPVKGLVNFSEMSEMVVKMKRIGSTLKDTSIDMYDNKPLVTTSSVTGGNKVALEPYCMMTSTTQLKSIKGLLNDSDAASGFLGRWVFSMGPLKERSLWGDSMGDLSRATVRLSQIFAWASTPPSGTEYRVLPVAQDARDESVRVWQTVGLPIKNADTTELFVRLDLLFKKLILLFAANSREERVSLQSVNSAAALFQYIIASYRAIGARIGVTALGQMEGRVAKALQNYQKNHPAAQPPTATNLKKVLPKQMTVKDLKEILSNLISVGMVELVPKPTGTGKGNFGDRYRYVG